MTDMTDVPTVTAVRFTVLRGGAGAYVDGKPTTLGRHPTLPVGSGGLGHGRVGQTWLRPQGFGITRERVRVGHVPEC